MLTIFRFPLSTFEQFCIYNFLTSSYATGCASFLEEEEEEEEASTFCHITAVPSHWARLTYFSLSRPNQRLPACQRAFLVITQVDRLLTRLLGLHHLSSDSHKATILTFCTYSPNTLYCMCHIHLSSWSFERSFT